VNGSASAKDVPASRDEARRNNANIAKLPELLRRKLSSLHTPQRAENEPGRRAAANLLTKDEARRIASDMEIR
jgi:hypothetical protein